MTLNDVASMKCESCNKISLSTILGGIRCKKCRNIAIRKYINLMYESIIDDYEKLIDALSKERQQIKKVRWGHRHPGIFICRNE